MYGNYGAVKWDLTHPIQTAQSAYSHVRDYYIPQSLILSAERTDGEITKICVNAEAEETMQHQRQFAYMVAAPVIILGGYTLMGQHKHRMLGNTLIGLGALCAWWHHKEYTTVQALLTAKVVPPSGTEAVPITSVQEAAAAVAVEAAETAELIPSEAAEDEGEAAGFYGGLYDDIPTMAGEFVTKYYWFLIAGGAAWWFVGRKKGKK